MQARTADLLHEWLFQPSRPFKRGWFQLRYLIELGGKGGFLVNGASGYWGRYASAQKVVELCSRLVGPEENIALEIPNVKSNRPAYTVGIWGHQQSGVLTIEIPNWQAQCGSFERTIEVAQLANLLDQLGEHCAQPESHGYRYIEY